MWIALKLLLVTEADTYESETTDNELFINVETNNPHDSLFALVFLFFLHFFRIIPKKNYSRN
jgi:hypothetical protein